VPYQRGNNVFATGKFNQDRKDSWMQNSFNS